MPALTLVPPYAIKSNGKKKCLSEDVELAAIVCLAEAERKKKPGLFGVGGAEALAFLSKLHYPLWVIPHNGISFLIDGMNIHENKILYSKPPDIEAFVEHLRRSSNVQELYHSALRSHSETFSDFLSQTEISIRGFIADQKLLSDVRIFSHEITTKTADSSELESLIPAQVNEKRAVDICSRVVEHLQRLESEIKGFQFAIATASKETKRHVGKLQTEATHIREEYDLKVSDTRVEVDKTKEKLEQERDEKIEKIAQIHQKEVHSRLLERRGWNRELLKLEQNRSEFEKRRESRKQKGDEIGETRWNARLKDVQNRISDARGKIKSLSDFIRKSNKETEKTEKNLCDTYQKLMEEEEKKVTKLENLRTTELGKKDLEIDELQEETLRLVGKIEQLIELKIERAHAIKQAAIPWKTRTPILFYLPFYLIKYKNSQKDRYRIVPPVIAQENIGLIKKIRKKLRSYSLQSKMNTLLKPRSKSLKVLLDHFGEKMLENDEMRKTVNSVGNSRNLLTFESFEDKIKKGMEDLEAEGWIKSEEKAAILTTYLAKNNSNND